MATYYWVGGSGTWNTSTTTNWSLTSGGAGGAGVPTLTDDVIFDSNSDTGALITVTCSSARCKNITAAAADFGISFQSSSITVSGSLALNLANVYTNTSFVFDSATANTVAFNNLPGYTDYVTFQGTGSWTLLNNLRLDFTLTVSGGTLDFNGFYVQCAGFYSTGTTTRLIKLGTSTSFFINGPVSIAGSNVTVDPGTSKVVVYSNTSTVSAAGISFWDLEIQNAWSANINISTCNNLTLTTASTTTFSSTTPVVVNGTLNLQGSASEIARSVISGQVTAAAITNISNIDFYGATITGAAAPISGTNLGDAGGNTGISSFATPKTVYIVGSTDGSTGFSFTSGGAANIAAYPLPQDTIILNNSSPGTVFSIYTPGVYRLRGTFDASARTNTYTISMSQSAAFKGNVTLGSGVTVTGYSNPFGIVFYGYDNQTITQNSATLNTPLIVSKPSGSVSPSGNLTLSTTVGQLYLTQGTFSTNNNNVSVVTLAATGSPTIDIGTTALSITGNAAVIYSVSATTIFTNTKNINATYSGATGTRTFTGLTTSENSPNLNVTAGTDTLSISSASFNNLSTVGFTGVYSIFTAAIYGNLTLGAGTGTPSGITTFTSTSGTKTITTNGVTLPAVTFNGVGGTWQLQSNLTTSGTLTLTNGTLDLNSKTASVNTFSSTNTNIRSLLFGTSGVLNITTTTGGSIWNTSTSTNLSMSGSRDVRVTGVAASSRNFIAGSLVESSVPNITAVAGSGTFTPSGALGDLNLTGFTGSLSLTNNPSTYGSLTIPAGMTVATGGSITFASSSGVKTVNTNGINTPFAMVFNRAGGSWQLLSNLNLTDGTSTYSITLTNGALDLNNFNAYISTFSSSNSNVRSLSFGTGQITSIASGSAWTATLSTNFTVTHSAGAKISMTSATAKTFAGGSLSYPKLEQAGTGALTVSGSNSFTDITNTVQPTTVTFTSGTTQTFGAFNLRGTAGNLVTISPTTSTSSYGFSAPSGVIVDVDYISISRSTATGGAAWYAGANSVDGGNNVGWIFTATPTIAFATSVTSTGATGTVTVGQGAGAFPTSVTATGVVGNETVTTGATAFPTGVVGTTALGTAVAEVAVIVSGVQATASLNSVILFTNNYITPNGVQGTTQLGNESAAISITVSPTGVQASALVNSVTSVLGSAVVSPTKVTGTGAIGFVSIDIAGQIGVVGNVGTGVLGNVSVAAGANTTPTGVYAQGYLGTAAETGSTNVYMTGVSGTGRTGTVTTTTVNIFSVTGVQGLGRVGTVSLRTDQIISVTGLLATTQLGTATVYGIANVTPYGVYGTGYIGSVSITGNSYIYPSGVQGDTVLGETAVWITVDDNQNGAWAPISSISSSSWDTIPTSGNG